MTKNYSKLIKFIERQHKFEVKCGGAIRHPFREEDDSFYYIADMGYHFCLTISKNQFKTDAVRGDKYIGMIDHYMSKDRTELETYKIVKERNSYNKAIISEYVIFNDKLKVDRELINEALSLLDIKDEYLVPDGNATVQIGACGIKIYDELSMNSAFILGRRITE